MRIAIVGLGSIGRQHVRVVKEHLPDATVIAVRSGQGGAVPEDDVVDHHVNSPSQAIQLRADIAVICSPAPFHVMHAKEFITANVPVLIEKPLAFSTTEVEQQLTSLFSNSDTYKRSLVGYVLRYLPAYEHVYDILSRGSLGVLRAARIEARSYLPEWRPDIDYRESVSAKRALGGGVLRELSHEIDYAISLLGPLTSVVAMRNSTPTIEIDSEEKVEILARNNGDALISVYLDFAHQMPKREFRAWFDKGELHWDLLRHTIRIEHIDGSIDEKHIPVERDELFSRQLRHFLSCAQGLEPPRCSIADGVATLQAIDAVERSFENQEVVHVL